VDPHRARELLHRERSELAELSGRLTESSDLDESQDGSTGELNSLDQHLADRASDTFDREKDRSIAEGLAEKLEEIDAALGRIDDGEYGTCQVCGREIADERLEAVPATRFCREHAGSSVTESDAAVPDLEITQELEG